MYDDSKSHFQSSFYNGIEMFQCTNGVILNLGRGVRVISQKAREQVDF